MTEGTTTSGPALIANSHIKAVMLFVDFPNLQATESTSALYNRLVPKSRAWYNEVSYGRTQLEVTAVHRWFRMPHNFRDYGLADGISWIEQRNYIADAVAAADASVDFSPFTVIYVVAAKGSQVERSPAFHAYPGDGIHVDGTELSQGATFFEDTHSDPTYASHVLIHETGHILGLPDLYDVPNPVFWTLFRYAGGWDMMSWNDPSFHFLAWEKWKLGWLDPSQLTCLTKPGEVTATITPLERAGGLKAVVVPTGPSSAYVIEARKKIGQDAALCEEGVLIYTVDASVRSGYGPVRVRAAQRDTNGDLINQCGPLYNAPFDSSKGEVSHFEDNAAGLTVHVLASGASGYRVQVTRTSMVPQRQVDIVKQAGVGSELSPPQAPFVLAFFPFGMLWNLSREQAD